MASEKDSPVGVAQADDESNKDVSKLLSLVHIFEIYVCVVTQLYDGQELPIKNPDFSGTIFLV